MCKENIPICIHQEKCAKPALTIAVLKSSTAAPDILEACLQIKHSWMIYQLHTLKFAVHIRCDTEFSVTLADAVMNGLIQKPHSSLRTCTFRMLGMLLSCQPAPLGCSSRAFPLVLHPRVCGSIWGDVRKVIFLGSWLGRRQGDAICSVCIPCQRSSAAQVKSSGQVPLAAEST